jgi:uncharacterized protein YggE
MSLKLISLIGIAALMLCLTTVCAQDSSLRVAGIGTVQIPADIVIISVTAQNDSNNSALAAVSNAELCSHKYSY